MVWKSNISNMDEEFDYLSKSDLSGMKVNRKKFDENPLMESNEKFKSSSNSKNTKKKYTVTSEMVKQDKEINNKKEGVNNSF